MATCLLGDNGKFQNPIDYLYNRDLEHPSSELCFCGKHLHISGSTSSFPIRWYYDKTCIYHITYITKYKYEYNYKDYELDTKTKKITVSDIINKPYGPWRV